MTTVNNQPTISAEGMLPFQPFYEVSKAFKRMRVKRLLYIIVPFLLFALTGLVVWGTMQGESPTVLLLTLLFIVVVKTTLLVVFWHFFDRFELKRIWQATSRKEPTQWRFHKAELECVTAGKSDFVRYSDLACVVKTDSAMMLTQSATVAEVVPSEAFQTSEDFEKAFDRIAKSLEERQK